MTGQVVYIVCYDGEEDWAERLAGPLRAAGYDVIHDGTIAVGESQMAAATKMLATGAPIVLCATLRAVGSSLAHQIVNAAHSSGINRVFVVKMEAPAHTDNLAVRTKVARFDRDPAQAINELLGALAKHYPAEPQSPPVEAPAAVDDVGQHLDTPTRLTRYDTNALMRFRAMLRPEIAVEFPDLLSPREFLERAALISGDRLTGTGALLFAEQPVAAFPAAALQCARYFGTDRSAVRDKRRFEGTVPDQIVAARDFVADHVQLGERPSIEQAAASIVYRYPMVAVREIIANAVVHRDYRVAGAVVHVRIFDDRLEVASPGLWIGREFDDGISRELTSLIGESIKRNHLLARSLSWIRLVEGEGSGIPSVLADCAHTAAPDPVVEQSQGFITVTLFPRSPDPNPASVSGARDAVRVTGPFGSGSESTHAVVGRCPAAPPGFIVRDVGNELAQMLSETSESAVCVVVVGMGGVGKTHVAAAYARSWIRERRGLVGWVNAESPGSAVADLARIADVIGVGDPAGDAAVSATRLRERLASWSGDSLIVFDNAVDPDRILPLMPTLGRTRVVITSRDSAFVEFGRSVVVPVFSRTESLRYLRERTGLNDESGADYLAAELGDHPLALASATAHIRQRRFDSYTRYLADLHRYSIHDALRRIPGHGYERSVDAALVMSIDAVIADTDRVSADLIGILAILSPRGVRIDVLDGLDSGRADPEAASPALAEAIERCLRGSLIALSDAEGTLMMHRLLARVVRERASAAGELIQLQVRALQLLEPQLFDESHAWNRRDLGSHLVWQIEALWASGIAGAPQEIIERAVAMRSWGVRQLRAVADLTRAAEVARLTATDCELILGGSHPETLTAQSNLAGVYREVGRVGEAVALYERVGDIAASRLGSDHPLTLRLRNDLAGALVSAGRFVEAIVLLEATVADRERVLGIDHPHTLSSRDDLAGAYRSVLRLREAILLYERTLADRVRVLGEVHPHALATRHNLASAYGSAGRLEEAIALFERTLSDCRRVLGPDHPGTVTAQNNLASAYRLAGRLREAVELFERAFGDCLRVLGHDHPNTLTAQNNLASAYRSAGRLGEAVELFEQALGDCLRVLGHDHPDTLTAQNNLASAYHSAGRLEEAIALFERTLSDCRRVLGPDYPGTVAAQNNLAGAYRSAGRPGEAIALFERTLSDCRRVLGPDHPDTLTAQNNLAGAYRSAGRPEEAIGQFERTLADRDRVLGPDHPDTLTSKYGLAGAYKTNYQFDKALSLFQRTLADRERVLGPDHPDTLSTQSSLAEVYKWTSASAESIALFERTLAARERVSGPDHPDTLRTRYGLAGAYRAAFRFDNAIAEFERVLVDYRRVFGSDYRTTITVQKKLADVRVLARRGRGLAQVRPGEFADSSGSNLGEITRYMPAFDNEPFDEH